MPKRDLNDAEYKDWALDLLHERYRRGPPQQQQGRGGGRSDRGRSGSRGRHNQSQGNNTRRDLSQGNNTRRDQAQGNNTRHGQPHGNNTQQALSQGHNTRMTYPIDPDTPFEHKQSRISKDDAPADSFTFFQRFMGDNGSWNSKEFLAAEIAENRPRACLPHLTLFHGCAGKDAAAGLCGGHHCLRSRKARQEGAICPNLLDFGFCPLGFKSHADFFHPIYSAQSLTSIDGSTLVSVEGTPVNGASGSGTAPSSGLAPCDTGYVYPAESLPRYRALREQIVSSEDKFQDLQDAYPQTDQFPDNAKLCKKLLDDRMLHRFRVESQIGLRLVYNLAAVTGPVPDHVWLWQTPDKRCPAELVAQLVQPFAGYPYGPEHMHSYTLFEEFFKKNVFHSDGTFNLAFYEDLPHGPTDKQRSDHAVYIAAQLDAAVDRCLAADRNSRSDLVIYKAYLKDLKKTLAQDEANLRKTPADAALEAQIAKDTVTVDAAVDEVNRLRAVMVAAGVALKAALEARDGPVAMIA